MGSTINKDSDYEHILDYPFFWPYIFYLKPKIDSIEQSDDFVKELNYKKGCLRRKDLLQRGWPNCLIDHYGPDLKDKDFYFDKDRIEKIEKSETFQIYIEIIRNSWTRVQLFSKGLSDTLFKNVFPQPDLSVGNLNFYLKSKIEGFKNKMNYSDLNDLRSDYNTLLLWCKSGKMTFSEFIEEFVFVIPIIDDEVLKEDACNSFNNYIDSNPSYDGYWMENEWFGVDYVYPEDNITKVARVCMNYLRHKQTPYDVIWKTFRIINCDEYGDFHYKIKTKVNDAIRKAYPWIDRYC